jgi:23S rRNA pseudouridine1911/1915/1917 synthase
MNTTPQDTHLDAAAMPPPTTILDVLYEDNHLLVVNKPAGLPTMGVAENRPSLLLLAKDYVARKYNKPGNVYLGIVSRLDAPVTGVVLMARTSKAAARLSAQFRAREVEKQYWAVVEGKIEPTQATVTHYLLKDERHRKMHTTHAQARGAVQAVLHYDLLKFERGLSLIEVRPHTGRKHQIRVQLAKLGFPIVGDRKYGSRRTLPAGIALHARRLVIEHPVRREPAAFEAAVPASWESLALKSD